MGFIFFKNQPIYCEDASICSRFNEFSIYVLLKNFWGFESSYNSEWWFFMSYIIAIITFPIIKWIIDKNEIYINVLLIIIMSILVGNVFPAIGKCKELGILNSNFLYIILFCQSTFVPCFWGGMLFAKEELLVHLAKNLRDNKMLNPFYDICIWIVIAFLREAVMEETIDFILVPILIVTAIDFLNRTKCLKLMLIKIGERSTSMWLIHTFFCYYFGKVARIIVITKDAILSLIILVIFSYLAALIIDYAGMQVSKWFLKSKHKIA